MTKQMVKSAFVNCYYCRLEINLSTCTIDDAGNVKELAVCPWCGKTNKGIHLDGWPFEIDFE